MIRVDAFSIPKGEFHILQRKGIWNSNYDSVYATFVLVPDSFQEGQRIVHMLQYLSHD